MRIPITFTVEIDPEAWAARFGTDRAVASIRADVRRYLRTSARDQLAELGVLGGDP